MMRSMRRFWFWYLPVAVAAVFTAVFAYGFIIGVRGGVGTRVTVPEASVLPADATTKGPMRILVVGDSLARGTGDQTGLGIHGNLAAELRRRKIDHKPPVNLAVNGAKTADLVATLESANVRRLASESRVIIVSIGGNDLFGAANRDNADQRPVMKNPAEVMNDIEERVASVVTTARSASPKARIFVIGLYNPFSSTPFAAQTHAAVAEWNARLLRRFASDRGISIVATADLFSHHDRLSADRFHPGAEGYALIGRRIADAL